MSKPLPIDILSEDTESFISGYLSHLRGLLCQLDGKELTNFAKALLDARARNARIFFIGNGGSAATASHFANDIALGTQSWEKPFRAMSLTDNVSVITAIANDFSYEDIFLKQLKILMQAEDVVVAISASGNSRNVVKAIEYANANGAVTVALTGFDGGEVKNISNFNVHVPTEKGEYGPVEDVHLVVDHLITRYLMNVCGKEEKERG